eukprot:1091660_1
MGASFGCCIDEEPERVFRRQTVNTDPKLDTLEPHYIQEYSGRMIRDISPKQSGGEEFETVSSNTNTATVSIPSNLFSDYTLTENSTEQQSTIEPDDPLPVDDKPPERSPPSPNIQPDTPTQSDHDEEDDTCTETAQIQIDTTHEIDRMDSEESDTKDSDHLPIEPPPNDDADDTDKRIESDHEDDENTEQIASQTTMEVHVQNEEEEEEDHIQEKEQSEHELDEEEEHQEPETTPTKSQDQTPTKTEDQTPIPKECKEPEISPSKSDDEEPINDKEKKENLNPPDNQLFIEQQFISTLMDDGNDSDDASPDTVVIPEEDEEVVTEEDEASKRRLLFHKYKSTKQMLDDESILSLLSMKLSDDVVRVVGDRSEYVLPLESKDAMFHLERDLRKIKFSIKNIAVSDQRKYAKIMILKHYTILSAIYTKYCKIGGDRHWLNYDGYISLLRDVGVITMEHNNDRYFEVFHSLFESHHQKQKVNKHSTQLSGMYGHQSFHDSDPWTGIWCLQRDKQRIRQIEKETRQKEEMERKMARNVRLNKRHKSKSRPRVKRKMSIKQKSEQYVEKYKLRKIGDKRIIGCMNNIDYAELGGTFSKSNYTKAKIEIKFKKRRIKVYNSRRVWSCELIPPKSIIDDITMKVKWEEINQNAAKSKAGVIKLYKQDDLLDDDTDIPKSQYVGLSRSEFFDAMLCCSKILYSEEKDTNDDDDDVPFTGGWLGRIDSAHEKEDDDVTGDLYVQFDRLVVEYLDKYIYRNHCEGEKYLADDDEEVKEKLKGCSTVLMKLFKKYADLDNSKFTTKQIQEIDCDEWSAMAVDLLKVARSFDKTIWKLGGKPTMIEILQCFTLCKNENLLLMNHDEISFGEFQRCLIIFTNFIFKYHPKAKYSIVDHPFHDKLDLVLKWCEKLEAQQIRISSRSYMRSDTLKRIKRKKSKHGNAQSNQSVSSAHSYSPYHHHAATITAGSPRSDGGMPNSSAFSYLVPQLAATSNISNSL